MYSYFYALPYFMQKSDSSFKSWWEFSFETTFLLTLIIKKFEELE